MSNILDLPPDEFLASLNELAAGGVDTDELRRQYRRKNSVFAPIFDWADRSQQEMADQGRRPAAMGLLSKEVGTTGMDALRSLQFEPSNAVAGLLSGIFQGVDLPAAASMGLVPEQDMPMEALNTAGMLQLGGAASMGRGALDYDPTVARIFAGPRADTANLSMLERAKRLSASGADKNQIWNETGWFQLGDGQWRFEIDDRDVGLRPPAESAAMADDMRQQASDIRRSIADRRESLKTQPDLFPETIRKENAILTREAERLRREASGNYGPEWDPRTLGQRATYALTDSELQRAYPSLMRDTIVRTEQNLGGPFGLYDEGMGNLSVAPENYILGAKNELQRDPRGTLLHELQHAVQGYEGFARGSNQSRARELLMNMRDKAIGEARDRYSALFVAAPDDLQKAVFDYSLARQEGDLVKMADLEGRIFAAPGGKELVEANNAVHAASTQVVNADTAYDAYRRHLGELESRLVQERRDWTPAERRAVPPWAMKNYIPDDQQIKSFELAPVNPKDILPANASPLAGILAAQRQPSLLGGR